MGKRVDAIVIGGGLAGLACAKTLHEQGREFIMFERSDRIGGRLKTDEAGGYLFDHGFQVLQMAYPAARNMLDYGALELQRFPPGVRIRAGGRFHVLADPIRKPRFLLQAALSSVGSLNDRLRLARLARQTKQGELRALFTGAEMYALEFLEAYGFSEKMIEQFFRPFMAGVCLDPEIRVTHRFLLFVLRMFAEGDVAIPAGGMQQIPQQLLKALPPAAIQCNSEVREIIDGTVRLADGQHYHGRAIIIATQAPQADIWIPQDKPFPSCQEACLYFSAQQTPFKEPFLTLNGSGRGVINSVNFPSMVSSRYAPQGENLISVIVPGSSDGDDRLLESKVRHELEQWFGVQVEQWNYLRTYHIEHALTRPEPPTSDPFSVSPHIGRGLFDCSETRTLPSIQWALELGQRTGLAVGEYLAGTSGD